MKEFLRAELHAFDYCAANSSKCIAFAAKAAGKTFNVAHELAEWRLESALAIHHAARPGRRGRDDGRMGTRSRSSSRIQARAQTSRPGER